MPEPTTGNPPLPATDRARRHQAILRVVLLTLLLLALPIGMVVWGLRDSWQQRSGRATEEISAEATAPLRAALEQIAEDRWANVTVLPEAPTSPLLPVITWRVDTASKPGLVALMEKLRAGFSGRVLLLQGDSPDDFLTSYLVPMDVWVDALSPQLAAAGFPPPASPALPDENSPVFLEISTEKETGDE